MQREVKRIHVVQAGLVHGVLFAGMGLLIGLIYGAVGLIFGIIGITSATSSGSGPASTGAMELIALIGGMGLFGIILIPILYGTFGFFSGMIGALIYNLTAKLIGGFKVDIADISMARHQIGSDQQALGTNTAPSAQG